MRLLAPSLLLLLVAPGCDTSEPDAAAAVYVGNQGIFSDNGGSVTSYDPEAQTSVADAFPGLGGLVQNVEVVGGEVYVLLNYSDSFGSGRGRIAVVDPETNAVTRAFDVSTPRALAVSDLTAFVTNFYGASVTPVDLASGAVGTPIAVGANPEGIVEVDGRLFVVNYSDAGFGDGSTVSVISVSSRTVTATLDLGCDGPRFVFADDDDEVWVVCTGRTLFDADFNVVGEEPGAVVVLDADGSEVTRFALDGQVGSGALGTDAAYSDARDEVFVVVGDQVLTFDTDGNRQAGTLTIGDGVSALAYDDATDRFYLGRLDGQSPFAAPGTVTVHDRQGTLLDTFGAGVIPTDIAFVR